jgi:hypothetical protein
MMPVDFPVMIRHNQVAFSRQLLRGNRRTYLVEIEHLYTPYGFLVPMTNDSLDFIDFFEEGWATCSLSDRAPTALLIDHKARIYELVLGSTVPGETPGFSKLRVLPNFETGYVRSRLSIDDDRARCAMALTPDLVAAARLLEKNMETWGPEYEVFNIFDIVARLQKDKLTRSVPSHPYPKEK